MVHRRAGSGQMTSEQRSVDGRETQAQLAYRLIEEMIITLQLPPGKKISETSLSKRLGLGRTPIREALQRLSFEGTIYIVPRSGAFVSELDLVDQLGMIEVRRGIENVMAARAARFATSDVRAEFDRLADAFGAVAAAECSTAFMQVDMEFNALVAQTSNCKYAMHAIGPIEAQTRRFWYLHFQKFGDLKRVCQLHAAVARSIARNDESGARSASDKLMDYVDEYTRRTLLVLGM